MRGSLPKFAVTRSTRCAVTAAMQRALGVGVPGTGIIFIIPLGSIGGGTAGMRLLELAGDETDE